MEETQKSNESFDAPNRAVSPQLQTNKNKVTVSTLGKVLMFG
ncbi:MAG: hypothetical protein OEX01_08830 [Candidatus Bathyarchaeota archaeon]|nr:hypothetical protein [Candidatus Bathyarchaeota archaeon]